MPAPVLTERQHTITRLFVDGTSTTDIAGQLGLQIETINPVLKVVARKFGTREISRQVLKSFMDEYDSPLNKQIRGRQAFYSVPRP